MRNHLHTGVPTDSRSHPHGYEKQDVNVQYLVPNQWYQISIRVQKGVTTYSVNGEELFRYSITGSEGDGHFGLRLLQNHVLFTDFKVRIF